MSEKNIYAQILDAIAEGESVSMNTTIKGESGRISEGLSRTLEIVAQNRAEEGLSVVKPETVKNGGDFEISDASKRTSDRFGRRSYRAAGM